MNEITGISKVNNKQIVIRGSETIVKAINTLSRFGLVTFSRIMKFKSSEYAIHFFKPIKNIRDMYSLGNELLIVCSTDGMNDFKSRTKDFIDYMLVTNTEFKNRLDKITCILIDGDSEISKKIKSDRTMNADSRLIVPFFINELQSELTEELLNNRLREFLYEKDLFGVADPLRNESFFFGKDRSKVISELFARYKQGEAGGLFGLRRIGKTSILNLLKLRIAESDGAAVYFDCSSCHHFRWNDMLKYIISTIIKEYSVEKNENGNIIFQSQCIINLTEDRYSEMNVAESFRQDIEIIYKLLNNRRILIILDEIENVGFSTSPSEWWSQGSDSLYFWQVIRSSIQMNNTFFSFVVTGVNPMCVEMQSLNGYDNPIFGMLSPIYVSLFEYYDIKNMVTSIGGRVGIQFEDTVIGKFMEDYGGHPFLVRQVCSRITNGLTEQKITRPTLITRNNYDMKSSEYKQGVTSVIEQILGVVEKYYTTEFELLKRLALDGRNAFKREIALGEKSIQHLVGYCLIEKEDGEYFIRIRSIEEYIKSRFLYDSTLDTQKDKRARINIRRDDIEEKLRNIILYNFQLKYGKKSKEQIMSILKNTTLDNNQATKLMNSSTLKQALEELYLSQLKTIMEKDWKSFQNIFCDKSKFEAYFEILNRSRSAGAHVKNISQDDEVLFSVSFDYFEKALSEV